MELLNRFIVLTVFGFLCSCGNCQNINEAIFENNMLKVSFENNETHVITVPDLSCRISPNKPDFIFDKYYKINNDTLVLMLTRAIHIDIGKTRTPDGEKYIKDVEYVDKKLNPGESFETGVRIEDLKDLDINYLRIEYEKEYFFIKIK